MKNKKFFAVVGANGKMGQEIFNILKEKKISCFGVSKSGKSDGYRESYKLKEAPLQKASVIIDFSAPDIFEEIISAAVKYKIPLVSGTTGLSRKQLSHLKTESKKIPILWAPNMSIGVAVLKNTIQQLSRLKDFDFQIEEFHHHQKKDAPSGTAISLQDALKKSVKKNIPEILSIRAGGIIGVHRIHAVSNEEHLIFEHTALNRKVFAVGAVRAAHWLQQMKSGLYTIEDLIHEK